MEDVKKMMMKAEKGTGMFRKLMIQANVFVVVVAMVAAVMAAAPTPVAAQTTDGTVLCDGLAATIVGTDGDDVIKGSFRDDVIVGLGGNDIITGASGNDVICGGDGNDTLEGNSGDDRLFGESGDDVLSGASQADYLHGGDGDDTLDGGSGDDTLDGGNGEDHLDGLRQTDTCDDAEVAVRCETITFNGEPDNSETTEGTDVEGLLPPEGLLTCNGLIPTHVGTDGDDVIKGSFRDDVIIGLGGNDIIDGGAGADVICGGDGDDVIEGKSGNDWISGEAGNDTITGASGDDTIYGEDGDDLIHGDSQNDTIHGGDGDDRINGGSNDDTLDGGNGVDHVDGLWQTDICDDAETALNCETETSNGEPGSETPVDADFPDFDGDGIGDSEDDDIDGDGVDNNEDALPYDPTETEDTDFDGVGNIADGDDDNDGFLDEEDVFPTDYTDWADYDNDGIGDNADEDDDNDGVTDTDDAFPFDSDESVDTDFDGVGNNADEDDDNDDVPDVDDVFPLDSRLIADTDGDGIGDRYDIDLDGDGVDNFSDWFPADPNEHSDYDFDGIGDNSDPDADNDGVLNGDDAFPFDEDETADEDGNGIGDNHQATSDIDGDDILDINDADIDGDLHPNANDPFPTNGFEWADLDGDGIGDNTDTDTDGDGIEDTNDLLPRNPAVGVDADGDGTPDYYDLNPTDPSEPRFQMTGSLPTGAAAAITSQHLITDDELVITEEPVTADDPISPVAASPVIDFTIDGPFTNFDTARITLPLNPDSHGQPVEVWWYNEDARLWVRDGSDLQQTDTTVTVTVDHFSRFVAMQAGAHPFLETPAGYCQDAGLDVMFVVDVSGSTEHRYWLDGQWTTPSDPTPDSSGIGNGLDQTFERVEIVEDIVSGLDGFDRAGLTVFSSLAIGIEFDDVADDVDPFQGHNLVTFDSGDFADPNEPQSSGAETLLAELDEHLTPARDGTHHLTALAAAAATLNGDESSDRNKVIVVVTDGGTIFQPHSGLPQDLTDTSVIDAVGTDIPVHVIGFGPDVNEHVARIATETGGVYAENRTDDNYQSILARFSDTNDNSTRDTDNDGLTDCEEEDGIPLVTAIGWTTGQVNEANAESEAIQNGTLAEAEEDANGSLRKFWPTTEPDSFDTDNDFLWDGEEFYITDLRGVDGLSGDYQNLIDNGIFRVFDYRGHPRDENNPVNAAGEIHPDSGFTSGLAPSVDLLDAKLAEQQRVEARILSGEGDIQELAFLAYALEWYTGEPNFPSFSAVFNPRTQRVDSYINERRRGVQVAASNIYANPRFAEANGEEHLARFSTLFNSVDRIADPNVHIDGAAANLLSQIEDIDQELDLLDPSEDETLRYQRHVLMLELGEIVLRARNNEVGQPSFDADTPEEIVAAINTLTAQHNWPEDRSDFFSPAVSMSTTSAYRVVSLYATNDEQFDTRVQDLLTLLQHGDQEQPLTMPPQFVSELGEGIREGVESELDLRVLTTSDWERLIAELQASESQQLERALASATRLDPDGIRPGFHLTTPFLTQVEEQAYEFIIQQLYGTNSAGFLPVNGVTDGVLITDLTGRILLRQTINEPAAALSGDVRETVFRIWDDISLSHQLPDDGWAQRQTFLGGREFRDSSEFQTIRGFYENDLQAHRQSYELLQNAEVEPEQTRYRDFPIDDSILPFEVLDEFHAGVITTNDIQRFNAYMLARNLTPISAIQDPDSPLTRGNDDTINGGDIQAFIEQGITNGTLTDVEARAFLQTVEFGFVENNLDRTDIGLLAAGLFIAGSGVGSISVTAARVLYATAFAAEGTVIALDVSDGNFNSAFIGGAFLLFDVGDFARLSDDALRLVDDAFTPHQTVERLLREEALGEDIIFRLRENNFSNIAADLAARTGDTSGTQAADAAYLLTQGRQETITQLVNSGAVDTRQAAEAAFDEYERALRNQLDNPEAYDRHSLLFRSNPDAASAYGRFGNQAFNETGGIIDELAQIAGACRIGRSFSADTLVTLPDHSTRPISQITVGDEVLAWNLTTGSSVPEKVTATWPHTDTLYDAHLTDGSVLQVTEDHEFWNATDGEWQELHDIEPGDQLLTPDHTFISIQRIDWNTNDTAPAWDLTVDNQHNYFVSAQPNAPPLLAHNNTPSFRCAASVLVDADTSQALDDVADALTDDENTALFSTLSKLAEPQQERLLRLIADPDPQEAVRIARNAAADQPTTNALMSTEFAETALRGDFYQDFINAADASDSSRKIVDLINQIEDGRLTADRQTDLATILFNTSRARTAGEYLTGTGGQRRNSVINAYRKTRDGEVTTAVELEHMYLATVAPANRGGWDFADRVKGGYRWEVSTRNGIAGNWDSASQLQGSVQARSNIKTTAPTVSGTVTVGSGASSNVIGKEGESAVRRLFPLAGVAEQTTLRVRLKNGQVFDVIPDFLVAQRVDQGGTLILRYIESKASGIKTPTIEQLTDGQALLVDAIQRKQIASITYSANSRLGTLVDATPGAEGVVAIDSFELHVFDAI